MITKLRSSLTTKIFLVTCLLLTAVCALTYGLIAQLMPLTYTADQERLLAAQADRLAKQLEEYTLADCGPLLSQFTFQYGVPVSIQDSAGNVAGGVDPSDIMPTGEPELYRYVSKNCHPGTRQKAGYSMEVPGLLLCRTLGKAVCPCGCRGPPDLHFDFSSVDPYK